MNHNVRNLFFVYSSTGQLLIAGGGCYIRPEIEAAVVDQVRALVCTPEIVVRTWQTARQQDEAVTEAEVRDALQRLDPLWDELFPAEQARILQLLVERVDVGLDGVGIRLRTDGLSSLVADLRGREDARRVAA